MKKIFAFLLVALLLMGCSAEDSRLQWESTLKTESYAAITEKLGAPDTESAGSACYKGVPLGTLEGDLQLFYLDDQVVSRQFVFYMNGSTEESAQQAQSAFDAAAEYLTGEYGQPQAENQWVQGNLTICLVKSGTGTDGAPVFTVTYTLQN